MKKPQIAKLNYEEKTTIANLILDKLRNTPDILFSSNEIIHEVNQVGYKLTSPRFRKIINFLRQNNQPICAGRLGYCYTTDEEEILQTIVSLQQRISSINKAIIGLKSCRKIIQIDFI